MRYTTYIVKYTNECFTQTLMVNVHQAGIQLARGAEYIAQVITAYTYALSHSRLGHVIQGGLPPH